MRARRAVVSSFLKRYREALSLGLLLAIPVLAVALARSVYHVESDARYRHRTTEIARGLMRNIDHVEGLLTASSAVHQALDAMDAAQFAGFAHELLSAYPRISSLAYLPVVRSEDRARFERQVSSTRMRPFHIRERADGGDTRRAEPRERYAPVLHIEPLTPVNARLLGRDLLAEEPLAGVIGEAIDSGRVRSLIQRRALLMLKAVYYGYYPPRDAAERHAQAQGVYLARMPLGDILAGLLRVGERVELAPLAAGPRRAAIVEELAPVAAETASGATRLVELPMRLPDGEYRLRAAFRVTQPWYLMREAGMILAGGAVLTLLSAWLWWLRRRADQGLRRAAGQLHAEKERAEVALYSIGEAVVTTDERGRVDRLNAAAERLTGWSAEQAIGRDIREIVPLVREKDDQPLSSPFQRVYGGGESLSPCELMLLRADGGRVAITETAAPILDARGHVTGAVVVMRDMSRERELIRRATHQARHDALTGLHNRYAFEGDIRRAIDAAAEGEGRHVVCFIDLDRFKKINDSCGHAAGDQLLRQVAQLLKSGIRKEDVLARIGGDEFGILLRHCDLDQARATAENLRRKLADFRLIWDGEHFSVGLSIGLALIADGRLGAGEILKAADAACYMAKERGRNQVCVYRLDDEKLRRRSLDLRLANQLQDALDEDRLELFRQPIFDLRGDLKTPEGYEFLLRIRLADDGLCGPSKFLNIAERFDLLTLLDRAVVAKAFRLIQRYRAAPGARRTRFHINLSGQSIGRAEVLEFIQREASRRSIPPASVCFEIHESSVIENMDTAIAAMARLRDAGFRFALDDFGTGLSSMAYLKKLPVDMLKIDGEFVRSILSDPVDQALVRTINEISHMLGMRTMIERVEDRATLELLRKIGIDAVQGYYTGGPEAMVVENASGGLSLVRLRGA